MKSSMKRTFCFIIAIPIGFTLISCKRERAIQKEPSTPSAESPGIAGGNPERLAESKKTIVAKVNGIPISRFDLVAEMNAIAPQYLKPGEKRDPKTDEKIRKEALNRLIWRELAVQEAKKEGMKAPAEAVAQELNGIKAEMKTEEAFRENLASSGITEDELRKQIERSILIEMITEKEIFGKVTVDYDEAKNIHAKRKNTFRGPSGPLTFEEARPLIENELKATAVQKREDEWVEALKKGARIEFVP